MTRILITLILSTLFAVFSQAQDAGYWSSNYGPGGFFTPGAVIANNGDSGVLFVNPALLAFSPKSTATLSANVYHLESTKIRDGAGTGKDLKSLAPGIIPQMIGGTIAFKGKRPFSIGYALIHSSGINFKASQRQDKQFNVLDDSYSPGPEFYVGETILQNTATGTSGLLSAGIRLNEKLAAGISFEGMSYRQYLTNNYNSRALINQGILDTAFPMVGVSSNYVASFTDISLRIKAGVAYDAGPHHFGLTLTLPAVHLWGNATIVSDMVVSNLKLDPVLPQISLLASSRQEHLSTRLKTPLSLALGYLYDFTGGQLYIAAEYFGGLKEYNVVNPRNDYFIRPDTGNNNLFTRDFLKVKDLRRPVINFAIGLSHKVSPAVTTYVSFRTDATYADLSRYTDQTGYTVNTAFWDTYHMQLGGNFIKRKFNLRAGLLMAYGATGNYTREINFDNPRESNFMIGDGGHTRARHYSIGLLLSYIHNL